MGRKGHGFVTSAGVVCSNFRYHDKLKRMQRRNKAFDNDVEDMLYFEAAVSELDDTVLVEVKK